MQCAACELCVNDENRALDVFAAVLQEGAAKSSQIITRLWLVSPDTAAGLAILFPYLVHGNERVCQWTVAPCLQAARPR